MVTRSRNKFLVTVIISLLIISSVYTFVIPSVYAAEVTTEQKGLSALTNVVGLDLTKYDVKTQGSDWSNTINIAIGTYYWLTVDACDQYGPFFTGVTIDGNYYGTPVSVLVSPGSHSVRAEPYPGYSYLVGFSDGLGNGDYRQIYSDTQITAYYQSFW
jgi:hypothetical protein